LALGFAGTVGLAGPVWADDEEDEEEASSEVTEVEGGDEVADKSKDDERFFVFKPSDDRDVTDWSGTLTSSSFFYGERASGTDPLVIPDNGGIQLPAAVDSPRNRLFTDLRARATGRHISGSHWDVRADTRIRLVPNADTQSGQFSDNEYDVRELFFGRDGENTDFYLGRQFVNELAAVKVDGLKIDHEKNARWHVLGFAGLYPVRGSRSIDTDYPTGIDAAGNETGRVMPATAGLGASYRLERAYGSLGVVGILPLGDDVDTGEAETQRIFATSTGYWRQSVELDIYHFAVIDATGANGAALTNLTVGLNYVPSGNLRVNAQVISIDTETLNVQAQTRLENPQTPGGSEASIVVNNIAVARLAQQEARLSVSGSFLRRRFEVFAIGAARRRPEVVLPLEDGTMDVVIEEAQAADVTIGVVDRRSIKDLRLGLSYSRAFGLGNQNVNRSEFQVVNLNALKDLRNGKASVEGRLTYVSSSDDNNDMACLSPLDPLQCYGTSTASTFTLGLMGTYRIDRDWLGILSTNIGTQSITVEDAMQERLSLPRILTLSAFFRLAYRF
jgi:hypothetical protein